MKDNAMSGKPSRAGNYYFKKIRFTNAPQFHLLFIFESIPVNTLFMETAPFSPSKKESWKATCLL